MADWNEFLAKAEENLNGAELVLNNQLYNLAAKCAYYAMFQAAVAALLKFGIRPKGGLLSHSWVQAEFVTQFAYRRKLFPTLKAHLKDGERARNTADYISTQTSERTARRVVDKAREFVDTVRRVMVP